MFDGDQVATHVPQAMAIKDASDKMWVDSNRRLPSNGSITYTFKQDEVMGLSNIIDKSYSPECTYLDQSTTESRVELFKKILPEKYHNNLNLFSKFNTKLNKKAIHKFIDYAERNVEVYDWLHMLDILSKEGFHHSFGTLSINDFILDDPKNFNPDTVRNNAATAMIRSGARGNWDQFKQIAVEKGYISDITGKILPDPITHNLVQGLTSDEFFMTCYGGRKGLIDTADNTAKSGYLTRKLVYLLSPIQLLDDTHEETQTFSFYVRDEQIASMLMRRNVKDFGKVTMDNYKDLISQTIELYSPITCASPKICRKCYGDLFEIHHSKMIGVIAAQSLGERTTQLTLRTKHTSGSTEDKTKFLKPYFNMKNGIWKALVQGSFVVNNDVVIFNIDGEEFELSGFENFKPLISPSESEEVYVFYEGQKVAEVDMAAQDVVSAVTTLSSLLNNPYGDNSEKTIQEFLYEIIDIYGSYATIDLIHFELIVSILTRSSKDLYTPYRFNPTEGHKFLGLNKIIGMMPEQALAFERFSYHMKKYINEGVTNLKEFNNYSLLRSVML